jgi:hypothetical protein
VTKVKACLNIMDDNARVAKQQEKVSPTRGILKQKIKCGGKILAVKRQPIEPFPALPTSIGVTRVLPCLPDSNFPLPRSPSFWRLRESNGLCERF